MKVRDIMTANPICCTPDTPVEEAAQRMVEADCGCLPIVTEVETRVLVGVLTDRDIVCRMVARGRTGETTVGELMSGDVSVCGPDDSLDEVEHIMAARQVRRVPVVDGAGRCVGMVAQADLAKRKAASGKEMRRVLRRISRPSEQARNDGASWFASV